MPTSVATIYQHVINDVIENVKEDFEREGVDESILLELKKLWERKLRESGAVPSYTPQDADDDDDLGIYESSISEQQQQQQHIQQLHHHQQLQQLHQQQQQHQQQHLTLPSIDNMENVFLNEAQKFNQRLPPAQSLFSIKNEAFGKPQEYMPPVLNSYNPQLQTDFSLPRMASLDAQRQIRHRPDDLQSEQPSAKRSRSDTNIPQYDGVDDDALSSLAKLPSAADEFGDDDDDDDLDAGDAVDADEQLNSDDDLNSEDDENDEQKTPQTDNIVLAQYEKVNRSKNKWKCNLKYGILHLNGRDYLFHKANGDFDW